MKTPLAFVTAAALVLGLAGCEWMEQPGPRLRRECTSLVDEVLKQDETVKTNLLEAEFEKMPEVGPLPPRAVYPMERDYRHAENEDQRLQRAMDIKAYEAAKRAREDWLDELMKAHPEVWKRLFQQRREKAINECIVTRAQREGVVKP